MDLEQQLIDLLGHRSPKLEEALKWFDEEGYDSIEEMMDSEAAEDMINRLGLKPRKEETLRKRLDPEHPDNRAAPPGFHDIAPAMAPRTFSSVAPLEMSQGGPEGELSKEAPKGGNGAVPPNQWGLSVGQFNQFVCMCERDTERWARLAADTSYGKRPGVVNGYQFCEVRSNVPSHVPSNVPSNVLPHALCRSSSSPSQRAPAAVWRCCSTARRRRRRR